MTPTYPAPELVCPDPAHCPVGDTEITTLARRRALASTTVTTATHWFRVYHAAVGHADPNPGFGDTRFAPFDDASGERVPTIYLAETLEAALLETVLHDVGQVMPRVASERVLHGMLHARLVPPRDLDLIDLRDPALEDCGLRRSQVVSSPAEHYPCTRRVARILHAYRSGGRRLDGILWHSRQAELTGRPAQQVAVLFADRVPSGPGTWTLAQARTASGALLEGAGRARFDELAEVLAITVAPDAELDT